MFTVAHVPSEVGEGSPNRWIFPPCFLLIITFDNVECLFGIESLKPFDIFPPGLQKRYRSEMLLFDVNLNEDFLGKRKIQNHN